MLLVQSNHLKRNAAILWLTYVLTSLMGSQILSLPTRQLTLIWLASGIGVLLFLHAGRHAFWLVGSAALLVNGFNFGLEQVSLSWGLLILSNSLTDILQAWIAWEMLRRLHSQRRAFFTHPHDLLPFLLQVALLPALLTRWLMVLGLVWGGVLEMQWQVITLAIVQATLGSATGVLLILPFFWTDYRSGKKLTKLLLWLPLLSIPTALSLLYDPILFVLTFPIAVAIILRHHFEGALISVLLIALIAMIQMVGGYGIFAVDPGHAYFRLILLIICFAIPMLYLGLGLRENQIQHRHLDVLVKHRTEELETLNQKLKSVAMTDDLTGLMSRRSWFDTLHKYFETSRRHGHELGVVYLDLDYFKRINDTYGHPAGDQVLRAVGKVLLNSLRAGDYAGRIGGEEFAILLPQTSLKSVFEVSEKMRKKLQELELQTHLGLSLKITVSAGCTAQEQEDHSEEALILRADQALYLAKSGGRNRSEVLSLSEQKHD